MKAGQLNERYALMVTSLSSRVSGILEDRVFKSVGFLTLFYYY